MSATTRKLLLIVPVVLAAVVVGALILVSRQGSSTPSVPGGTSTLAGVGIAQDLVAGVQSNGDTLGDPAAKTTIIEYGDLRCPACAQFSASEIPTVVNDLVRPGRAKLQLRIWTIIPPLSDSQTAAQAAYAAARQNGMWTFADIWYANQGPESQAYATDEFVHAVAAGAGLDLARLDADRSSSAAAADWKAAEAEATKLGLTGTPSVVVIGPKGQKVFGDTVPSASDIAQAVQDLGG